MARPSLFSHGSKKMLEPIEPKKQLSGNVLAKKVTFIESEKKEESPKRI